jgi:peptide/nickel transport system permease protein
MLSRILFGSRISLTIGITATFLAAISGILLGVIAGYFVGRVDAAIMRLVDIQMAFPSILLALAVMVMLGPGLTNLVLVLAITSWVFFARIVRADVLSTKDREFMVAGRAVGATDSHLILRYIFPNLVSTITILITLTLARTIISESSLSFLGLGIEPPTPSWGGMLAEGRSYLSTAWWITTFPGISLMITVVGVNLLGDALRDVLDPRLDAGDY